MKLDIKSMTMAKKILAQRVWQGWNDDYDQNLDTGSVIIDLPQGQVEYCILGNGKPMVISHATPGGYDQAKLFAQPFVDNGYKVICWSRPGYLKTPLSSGRTFKEQAELLATLLDYLWIDSASFYGTSTGSVISLLLAKKYPERVDRLFLENPVSAETLSSHQLTQRDSLDGVLFSSQNDWFSNLFEKHFPQIPHKFSIRGESYFDESLLLDLLSKKFDIIGSQQILQLLKTTGPTEKKELGFYNDVYELTRSTFDISGLEMPHHIIKSEQEYSPLIFTTLGDLSS